MIPHPNHPGVLVLGSEVLERLTFCSSWCCPSTSSTSSSAWCSSAPQSGSRSSSTYRCWRITCGGRWKHFSWSSRSPRPPVTLPPPSVSPQVHEQTRDELPGTLRPHHHHERRHPGLLSKGGLVQAGLLPAVLLLLPLRVRLRVGAPTGPLSGPTRTFCSLDSNWEKTLFV